MMDNFVNRTKPPAMLHYGIRLGITAIFIAIALGLLFRVTRGSFDLFAFGCDDFAYARQAELLRANGLPTGLDTRVNAPEARFIIDVAASVSSDSTQWSEAVAPHCHHYNAAVGHVIDQYPPGTGLILSVFPESRSLGFAFIIGMTLISIVFVLIASQSSNVGGMIVGLATLALIDVTMMHPTALLSASVPISIAIIPLCAWLSLVAFPPPKERADVSLAAAFGLVAGLLVAIRLTNLFMLPGVACAIALNRELWRSAKIKESAAALVAAIGGFLLAGAGLVLTADWINAGSPFATTYSPHDATPPILSKELFTTNFAFYMGTGFAAPITVAAFVILILRTIVVSYRRRWSSSGASFGAIVCYALSLIFFCIHLVRIDYYMLPASSMTLCLIAFDIMLNKHAKASRAIDTLGWGILIVPFLILAAARSALLIPFSPTTAVPSEVRDSQSVVWADVTSGTLLHYQHKYAAKIIFSSACMQQHLIAKILQAGRPQYFIEDSPSMSEAIHNIAKNLPLRQIGDFKALKAYPIWKLDGDATWTAAQC
jgi:hypothetical protein